MEALNVSAIRASAEEPAVHEDDREAIEQIKTLLHSRQQVMADHAREAMRAVVEHEGRIGAIEGSMVELRQDAVNARVETNGALRDMATRIGELRGMRWYERVLQVVAWAGVSAWVWAQLIQLFLGSR